MRDISDAVFATSIDPKPSNMDILRLVTCGSVDDGKSTLIGRLLYDLNALSEDQLQDMRIGATRSLDFSLALDGLAAEREQGITIDVAYRSFSSLSRRFLIADVPGHEQYTRNMVTGASTADAALLVIDARKGLLIQARRHTYLAWLLGIRHFILAVNKMDLVAFEENVFHRLAVEYDKFLRQLGPVEWDAIPVAGRFGDNIVERSTKTPWFGGPTLSDALHDARVVDRRDAHPFRLPVQLVNRSIDNMRGYSGTVVAGKASVGDEVKVQPSDATARIAGILTFDGHLDSAACGEAVTLVLDREIDIGRGNLICGSEEPASSADALEATIIWMSESPLVRGRSYRIKIATKTVLGQVIRIESKVDPETLAVSPTEGLAINEIGKCFLTLEESVAFDSYERNRDTGGFILIDRISNDTVAAGLIHRGEVKFSHVPWQAVEVSKHSRSELKSHPSAVLWFTGISGAGKSTIANLVEKMLHARGRHTYLLDGDNVRHGLNRDLGFSDADRVENVRRVTEVAKLMSDAGLIVLVALISPFRAERRIARAMIGDDEFIEIFVDTPLELAEARDVKGLYRKARSGSLISFTGLDSMYEIPEHAEIHLDTTKVSAEEAAEAVVSYAERVLARSRADRLSKSRL